MMKTHVASILPLALAGISLLVSHTPTVTAQSQQRVTRVGARPAEGQADAVRVSGAALVHTSQLVSAETTGKDAAEQSLGVLRQLGLVLDEFDSKRSDVVKLNVYVRSAGVRKRFQQALVAWCGEDVPAVAYVATSLPDDEALVGLDAVFATEQAKAGHAVSLHRFDWLGNRADGSHAAVLPRGDAVYLSGQAVPGDLAAATSATLEGLLAALHHLQLQRQHIIQFKCFMKPISDVSVVQQKVAALFGDQPAPPVVYVQWNSPSRAIEIELIAAAPATTGPSSVTYTTPPGMKASPVFSRVARIHGTDRIYTSGIHARSAGDAASQVKSIFSQLQQTATASGSDMQHLAKATYYVADNDVSRKLTELRPDYYDPERPPAASKAAMIDIGIPDRTITIDIIAAPVAQQRGASAVRVLENVSYLGADRAEKLDLYLPTTAGPHPAVLIVHGGGWHGGDKAAKREQNIGHNLAAAGYVCASINYELTARSDHLGQKLRNIWPRNLYDCKTAVRFLRAHADEYKIDADRIGAIGGSAGGHLVAMLAATDVSDGLEPKGPYPQHSSRIQAVVPMYGVHDVLRQARLRENELTDDEVRLCREASPINYISSGDPPALVLHGTKDTTVPVEQSRILYEKLRDSNVIARLEIVEGAPHSFHLQPAQRDLRPLVIGFLDEHLKRRSGE